VGNFKPVILGIFSPVMTTIDISERQIRRCQSRQQRGNVMLLKARPIKKRFETGKRRVWAALHQIELSQGAMCLPEKLEITLGFGDGDALFELVGCLFPVALPEG
jgi:hypothetical protein